MLLLMTLHSHIQCSLLFHKKNVSIPPHTNKQKTNKQTNKTPPFYFYYPYSLRPKKRHRELMRGCAKRYRYKIRQIRTHNEIRSVKDSLIYAFSLTCHEVTRWAFMTPCCLLSIVRPCVNFFVQTTSPIPPGQIWWNLAQADEIIGLKSVKNKTRIRYDQF